MRYAKAVLPTLPAASALAAALVFPAADLDEVLKRGEQRARDDAER